MQFVFCYIFQGQFEKSFGMRVRKLKYEQRKEQGLVKAKSKPIGHSPTSTPVRRKAESPAKGRPKLKKKRLGMQGGKPADKPSLADRKPVPDGDFDRHLGELKQAMTLKMSDQNISHMTQLLWQASNLYS